jgi:hypothetical protein
LTNTPKWIIPRWVAILEGAASGCDLERRVSGGREVEGETYYYRPNRRVKRTKSIIV